MKGENLLQATKIVSLACKQVNALIDRLYSRLEERISELVDVSKVLHKNSEGIEDDSTWLTIRWLEDLGIQDYRKHKAHRHLAFQVWLYDEGEESLIPGWEPSIYIFYAPGQEEFCDDSVRISDFLEEGMELDQNDPRLWRWQEIDNYNVDAWFFAVPLVRINSEDDLDEQIVKPVISLLENDNPIKAFPQNSVAYSYSIDEDSIYLEAPDY